MENEKKMIIVRYNEQFYITKYFFPKNKYALLVNNGATYIKQPSDKFKIASAMYIPANTKDLLLKIFTDITFIEKNIIDYFYQGKESNKNKRNSFYNYQDISGLYIYVCFDEIDNCKKIMDLPLKAVARINSKQFEFASKNQEITLYLEDYLFNTNVKQYLLPHTDIQNSFYDIQDNLSLMTILNRYFMFHTK